LGGLGSIIAICEFAPHTSGGFHTQTPIAPSSPGYNANPTRGDAVHLALIVLPASDAMEAEVSDEVRKFLRYTRARGKSTAIGCARAPVGAAPVHGAHLHFVTLCPDLRTLVVLNKVDSLDPECASDLSTIYTSPKVLKMCCEASAACGVPVNNVFPMKSYSNEYEPDYRVGYGGAWSKGAVLRATHSMITDTRRPLFILIRLMLLRWLS
jgi:hypothetical protein